MTTPLTDQIEQAMARLREQQARMERVRDELQAATASVTSKDRMVTARVGPQGQVVALTFHTTAYRAMAPAQLSAVLVGILNEARAEMGERITEAMHSFSGLGDMLRHSMTGGTELDELLAPLRAMRPAPAGGEGATGDRKQEEFRG